jgi:hypothetical protein
MRLRRTEFYENWVRVFFERVATFKSRQEARGRCAHVWFLGGQPEQLPDEPDLTPNIIAPHPPNRHCHGKRQAGGKQDAQCDELRC